MRGRFGKLAERDVLPMGIARLSLILLLAGLLAAPVEVYAQDSVPAQEPKRTKAEERKAEREAKKKAKEDLKAAKRSGDKDAVAAAEEASKELEYKKKGKGFDYTKEFKALREAQALLAEVNDEVAAEKAVRKIKSSFGALPIPLSGTDQEIEMWSTEQNKVSAQMLRLKGQPWFESVGLQEVWTLVSDPFSRRRAQKTK